MVTRHMMTRSLPAFLFLMAIAVVLILAGSAGTGFALGLVVIGIAAVLLASMFIDEVRSPERHRYRAEPRRHQRPQASGY
jgi:multisubunit Na+/H+ antiporter MnhB subunit